MGNLFSCVEEQQDKDQDVKVGMRRKMAIVGDGACGKTSMITAMFTDQGPEGNIYVPTVFDMKQFDVNTGDEKVQLVVYDTAGQEGYNRLRPMSYNDLDVVLICFSLPDPDTLDNVSEKWAPEIVHFCGYIPIILVGNKKDLCDTETNLAKSTFFCPATESTDGREGISMKDLQSSTAPNSSSSVCPDDLPHTVKRNDALLVAKRIGAVAYFETSALTCENVDDLRNATVKASVLGAKKCQDFKPFTNTLRPSKY